MRDEPLKVHPQSGLSVRRLMSGGWPGCHD